MSIKWNRDSQGLHADSTDGTLRLYVRRVPNGVRASFSDVVEVAGIRVADQTRPMVTITVADTQKMAKAIAAAFDAEPWSDGSAKGRSTRAIQRAYEEN